MQDVFIRRMQKKIIPSTNDYNLASRFISNANIIENATFTNDPNWHVGMLYNQMLEPLREVDFKLQKNKSYDPSQDVVDYQIQFRPGFHPEQEFKYSDGRERTGFYIDVADPEDRSHVCKWLIYGKDERHSLDRYVALQCNWEFEWVISDDPKSYTKTYYHTLGVLRDSSNENSTVWRDTLTETMSQQIYFVVPTTDVTRTIDYNTRFMLSDNPLHPRTFDVTKIFDTAPFGITKFVLSQCMREPHRDFNGSSEELKKYNSYVDASLIPTFDDLYGGDYHQICDILRDNIQDSTDNFKKDESKNTDINSEWKLSKVGDKIYVNAQPVIIKATNTNKDAASPEWHLYIDGEEYTFKNGELKEYFDIKLNSNTLSIRAINYVMAGYVLKVSIKDQYGKISDSVELEVVN